MTQDDSLVEIPVEKWCLLQEAFKSDWPRGVSGYNVLETQRTWLQNGLGYGFKVFCPFGDAKCGMVALNQKDIFYEVIIQCPVTNTEVLEKALSETKVIDWARRIIVPFAPDHVVECVKRVAKILNINIELILPSESFVLETSIEKFDINVPSNIQFGYLTSEHIDLVNSTWPHKYPGSEWYFDILIKNKAGFGLFENNNLVSWVFINESGTLGHAFTVENHRKKGYAELLLKVITNKLIDEKKDVLVYAVKGNTSSCNLYRKVGYKNVNLGIAWCYLNSNISS